MEGLVQSDTPQLKSTADGNYNHSYMVMAGAGAGKTTRLVRHIVENFLSFKKNHKRWPRIIGTTFTKKAASEIQDRVSKLYKDYDDPEIFDYAYSSYLKIGTIHSMCLEILRFKSYLLGFSQKIKISNDFDFKPEKEKILYNLLRNEFKDLLLFYNFNQLVEIISFFESRQEYEFRPITIEAQEDLSKEIFYKIRNEFVSKLKYLKTLDLPTKSQNGIEYLNQISDVFAHSNDFNGLNDFFKLNAFRKPTIKFDSIEAQEAWSDIWEYRNKIKKQLDSKFYSYFNKESFAPLSKNANLIHELFLKYKSQIITYKKTNSVIEMSDIEILTLELLKNHYDSCKDILDQVDYYYIDEYQDTSIVQKEIFSILLKNKNYFKVGDPQQSIYLFRGANSSIFTNEFSEANSDVNISTEFLSKNYRSEQNLLLGVNELFEHIDPLNFKEMQPRDNNDTIGSRIKIIKGLDDDSEIVEAIKIINQKIESGIKLSDICILGRTKSILKNLEIELQKLNIPAVSLVSGNFKNRTEIRESLIFLSFLEEPNDDKLFCALMRSQSFLISDFDLLKIVNDCKKDKSWSIWTYLKKINFFDTTNSTENFNGLFELKKYHEMYEQYGLVETFKNFLVNSKILKVAKNTTDLNRKHSNLIKLLTEVVSNGLESVNLSTGLSSILDIKSNNQESEAIFSESDQGIRLMTIHGSKGLEFDEVIILGCNRKGSLSHSECVEFDENGRFVIPYNDFELNKNIGGPLLELSSRFRVENQKRETLRLIYVAVTRAKKSLYLLGQKKIFDNSILKNLKLNNSVKFKYIEIEDKSTDQRDDFVDHESTDDQGFEPDDFLEDVVPERIWKGNEFVNRQFVFDIVTDVENSKELILNQNQDSSSKKIKNISVTSLIHTFYASGKKIPYEIKNEIDFEPIKISRASLDNNKANPNKIKSNQILIGLTYHKYLELFARGVSKDYLNLRFKSTYLGDMTNISVTLDSILKTKNIPFNEILSDPKIEWGFNSLLTPELLVSGQIDLWGFDQKNEIHIFDYKTGSSRLNQRSVLQLLTYDAVIKKLYPNIVVHNHLMYLTEGKIMSLNFSKNSYQVFENLLSQVIPTSEINSPSR